MYDFIKLEIENLKEVKDYDSLKPYYRKSDNGTAYKTEYDYRNLTLTVWENGYMELKGSWHKWYNNGVHNYNDFTLQNFIDITQELSELFNVDLWACKLLNVETGVNITPPIECNLILYNLISHKGKEFSRQVDENKVFYEVKHQRYYLKIYNKAIQYKDLINHNDEILRCELKYIKTKDLNQCGITLLKDLIDKNNILELETRLIDRFKEVIIYDSTIKEDELTPREKTKLKDWNNPNYWRELTRGERSRQKNKFYKVIENHSDRIQEKIIHTIELKCRRINRPPEKDKCRRINPLYIGLKRNTTELKYCSVTGIDITHQKGRSKYISQATIFNLYETDREKYLGLETTYLKNKSKYPDIQKKCYLIAHNIRNLTSNPRNNLKRRIEEGVK